MAGGYSASAKVVDGTLILSMPDAIDPCLWQTDVSGVKEGMLEIQENENGHFVLLSRVAKGAAKEVAPFATRARAVGALMAASQALQQAHGQIRPAVYGEAGGHADARQFSAAPISAANYPAAGYAPSGASAERAARGGKGAVFGVLLGFILLAGLAWAFFTMAPVQAPGTPSGGAAGTAPAAGASSAAAPPPGAGGVSLDANDFLRGR